PWGQSAQHSLQVRKAAAPFLLHLAQPAYADLAEVPRWYQILDGEVIVVDAKPLAHVGHQGGVGAESAVRDAAQDARIVAGDPQTGVAALADAEEAHAARVGVGPAAQVRHGRLSV